MKKIMVFLIIGLFVLIGCEKEGVITTSKETPFIGGTNGLLVDLLEDKGSITFAELFSPKPDKSEVIITFLATLEMVKLHLVRVAQHVQTGIIRLFYI